jgi:peroxiredoxin
MRLTAGDKARDFEVKDLSGSKVSLGEYRGKRLMLSFYRYASCPLCNLRVHELAGHYDSMKEKGLLMLAFFQSPEDSIRRYVGKQDPPFRIVADPERKVYRLYGVESSWAGFLKGSLRVSSMIAAAGKGFFPGKMEGDKAMIPADFLIGPDLIVERAYYGADIGDHMPLEDITAWLASSKSE